MPKKTKASSKKATKGKAKAPAVKDGPAPTVEDGPSTEKKKTPKEQLKEIVHLQGEVDREKLERNYFQAEKDQLRSLWEITKRDLEEREADLRSKGMEMMEAEEQHQLELKVYIQKVKHLQYEHQNTISELKAEGVVSTQVLQQEHSGLEHELRKAMRALKVDLREQELSYETLIKDLKLKNEEELTGIRHDFERQVREIEAIYKENIQVLYQKQDHKRKNKIHELEDHQQSHIASLVNNHDKLFSEMKTFYNDTTRNNVEEINTLTQQVHDMRTEGEKMEKELKRQILENKRMTEPLQRATGAVEELQKQLSNYEKDKASLASARARLKVGEQDMKDLKWKHAVLEELFTQLQMERDELYQKSTQTIQKEQQKIGFKNLLLEQKMAALTDSLQKKEAQLNQVLSATNMDQTALGVITRKLEEVLDSKNIAIKDLQYELARVCKAHNDLLRTYEAKLRTFDIPVEELGFNSLKSTLIVQTLGQGPAGLHTK